MENGDENIRWKQMLDKYERGTRREKNEVLSKTFGSVNYQDCGWKLVSWSPDWFDIEDARMAVTEALNSPTSIPGKQYVAPLVEGAGSSLGFGLKKREALVRTVDSDSSRGFFEEVVSTKRATSAPLLVRNVGTRTTSGSVRGARRGIIVRRDVRRSAVAMCPAPFNCFFDRRSYRRTGRSCTGLNVKHSKNAYDPWCTMRSQSNDPDVIYDENMSSA